MYKIKSTPVTCSNVTNFNIAGIETIPAIVLNLIKFLIPLRKFSKTGPQIRTRLKSKITLQRRCIRISNRHITRLHRHQFLMTVKIIIFRKNSRTNQLLLQKMKIMMIQLRHQLILVQAFALEKSLFQTHLTLQLVM